jgi:hypothetical protein
MRAKDEVSNRNIKEENVVPVKFANDLKVLKHL